MKRTVQSMKNQISNNIIIYRKLLNAMTGEKKSPKIVYT